MYKLLNDEYYHLGTNKFFKELWLYPQMEQIHKNYIKPYGGIWTSHTNPYTLCDWIEYKEERLGESISENIDHLDSSLIKFKTNSKFIKIENTNDYKNLKDSGFVKLLDKPIKINKWYSEVIIEELIDYEKISEYYELMYATDYAHKNLSSFSIKTMLALKPESIEYYKPILVDYKNHKILEVKNKEFLSEPNEDYFKFVEYVRSLFPNIKEDNYDLFIQKLYNETKKIEQDIFSNKQNIIPTLNNSINKLELVKTVIKNIYRDKYIEKQKCLSLK